MKMLVRALDTFPFRTFVAVFTLIGVATAAFLLGMGTFQVAHGSVLEGRPPALAMQSPVVMPGYTPPDRVLLAAWGTVFGVYSVIEDQVVLVTHLDRSEWDAD